MLKSLKHEKTENGKSIPAVYLLDAFWKDMRSILHYPKVCILYKKHIWT